MAERFLPKDKITDFLQELSKESSVYAPYMEKQTVLFKKFDSKAQICLERPANAGPKGIIYPQCETLLSFKYIKDDKDPKKSTLELKTGAPYPQTIIFGARPCDANGFTVYDRVFADSDISDPYYKERREKTVIISAGCSDPFAGCFCTAVGGGPADGAGSDVLMTDLGDGYFLETLTAKGEKAINASSLKDGSEYKDKASKIKKDAAEKLKNPFTKDATKEIPAGLFELDEFWEKIASKCISCGACTYLCPTCYCFNITDEQKRLDGERIRTWDACMFNHFTLEASGHNPRPTKFKRYKNRVGHKFVYYPKKYNGVNACVGCGRCIRYCPASVDISEAVGYLKDPKQDLKDWDIKK